jgi:hypothetical protein
MKTNKPLIAAAVVLFAAVLVFAVQHFRAERPGDAARAAQPVAKDPGHSHVAVLADGKIGSSGASRVALDAKAERAPARQTTQPATVRELLAQRDPMSRIRGMLDFVEGIPAHGIAGALKQLREQTSEADPEARMLAHMLLTRWAKEDPEAAFASLAAIDFKKQGGDATSLLASLASQDPVRAAAWLKDPNHALLYIPAMGQILAGAVAKEWGRQDPMAALDWARTLPDNQRLGAYVGVLGTMAGTNPAAAASLTMGLEPGSARSFVAGQVAESWAKQAPHEALAWVRTLEGSERHLSLNRALASWAQTQPADAARYLDSLGGQEDAGGHLRAVAAPWAAHAPADAAEWVGAQPEGTGKSEAMGHVMWNWTTLDPQSASNWLSTQPPGASKDSGIGGLAKAAFDTDPAGALGWATQISNEQARAQSVAIGLREWTKRDAVAAQAWAANNGVPLPVPSGAAGK